MDATFTGPPHWLIEMAVEPKSKAEQDTFGIALAKLAAEDSSFQVSSDPQSGQTIIKGTDELHINSKIDTLKRTYNVEVNIGAPQVSYREAVRERVEHDYTYKKQFGGIGQFARIRFILEPNETAKGFAFESKIVGGAVPDKYIPGIEKGLNSIVGAGILAGFPIIDIKVTLIDGAYHEGHSSALAFEIAARQGLREALQKAGCVLLEPIMKTEVTTPQDCSGSVIADLKSRRGWIQSQNLRGDTTIITATVPLAFLFGYLNNLRSMSRARATFTMQFDHYAAVPRRDDDPPAIGMRA